MSIKAFVFDHLKICKIIAAVIAFALTAGLLLFAVALLGNPISYGMVKSRAQKYIAENYADEDYVLTDVSYSFKFGDYLAHIEKPGSEDCRFTLFYGMNGKFNGDNYESLVQGGFNVRTRLDIRYRELCDTVFESAAFPYAGDISFGELVFEGDGQDFYQTKFGLSGSILKPDAVYDIPELGRQAGRITVDVDSEDVSSEKAAEVLLNIKKVMEQGGAPFYAINLELEAPDGKYCELVNFLAADIHEDGLVERVNANRQKTEELYALEAEKKRES